MTLTPEQIQEIETRHLADDRNTSTHDAGNQRHRDRAALLAYVKELSAAKPQGRGSSSWNFDREADAVNEITPAQPSPSDDEAKIIEIDGVPTPQQIAEIRGRFDDINGYTESQRFPTHHMVAQMMWDMQALLRAHEPQPSPDRAEPRKRDKDETLLTHQIRCYSEYVRNEPDHGPNRSEIANILSCHAPYISEYINRLTTPQAPPEDAWRMPPPHFKPDPRWSRQPQSYEEWDAHKDTDHQFNAKRRLAFAGDLADPRAPAGMALVSRWDITTVLMRLTWLEARFENTRDSALPEPPAPSAPTREQVNQAFAQKMFQMDFSKIHGTARKAVEGLTETYFDLFPLSPSPEQRGET